MAVGAFGTNRRVVLGSNQNKRRPSLQQQSMMMSLVKWTTGFICMVLLVIIHQLQQTTRTTTTATDGSISITTTATKIALPYDDDFIQSKVDPLPLTSSSLGSSSPYETDDFSATTASNSNIHFVERFCHLSSSSSSTIDWYPSSQENAWQQRTPYFLLAGAKKCGTTSLAAYLGYHPHIARPRTKELLFFLPQRFDHWTIAGKHDEREQTTRSITGYHDEDMYYYGQTVAADQRVQVQQARIEMYENDYDAEGMMATHDNILSFDATPGYLFRTESIVPILCTIPWAKLLVILRDPIDRILSHYNFVRDPKRSARALPPFDVWVEQDLHVLREAGVLSPSLSTDDDGKNDFFGSQEEADAWGRYQETINAKESPVGRSLYAIQLEIWFRAFRDIGRDPLTDILVVRNEELKVDPQGVLDQIFWWLELPTYNITNSKERMTTTYTLTEMKNETRKMLEELFRPYNQRLYNLLGGDWQDYFENLPKKKAKRSIDTDEGVGSKPPEDKGADSGSNKLSAPISERERLRKGLVPHYDFPSIDMAKSEAFRKRWCQLDDYIRWVPEGTNAWKRRAPYFLLPGAKKSGTTSLAKLLMEHPLMEGARTKELQFFLNKNFRADFVDNNDGRTRVHEARKKMYAMEYHSSALRENEKLISFDATPGYLFHSAMLPQRILCVAPWIKLLVILRNPIDRAFSNHAYAMRVQNGHLSFEEYIQSDLDALHASGFLNATTLEEENETWRTYLGLKREGVLGRSIYYIQVRQWMEAFAAIGRDPKTEIRLVNTEDMNSDETVHAMYDEILTFLGLPRFPLNHTVHAVRSNYVAPMKSRTRKRLQELFEPMNQKFYDLIGRGTKWDGIWDPEPTTGSH